MSLGMSLNRAVVRGLVVMALLGLFGGLWAVFASSARADSHTAVIIFTCEEFTVNLSNYDNPSVNPDRRTLGQNRLTIMFNDVDLADDVDFGEQFGITLGFPSDAPMGGMTALSDRIVVDVFDPEDPDGEQGWTFRREVAIPENCDEPTTITLTGATTAPTATTASTVAPSTLPLTGVDTVSWALLAVVLFGSGALILLITRRAED